MCRGCGAYTQPRNGKGDAYAYCKACHPGAVARRWTRELVLEAMIDWQCRFGRLPTSNDWSATHARQRGGEALERLSVRRWPPASVVTAVCGSWAAARAAAQAVEVVQEEDRDGDSPARRPSGVARVAAGTTRVFLHAAPTRHSLSARTPARDEP